VERGTRLPAFITALGKSLLARLDPDQLATHLPARLAYKPLGIENIPRPALMEELARIRRQGYAELQDAGYRNAGAIGITIVPQGGAGVSFAANYPLGLTDDATVRKLTDRLMEHAATIARQVDDRDWFAMQQAGG
jgi:DNA-binding IclR family transcriptional regulator